MTNESLMIVFIMAIVAFLVFYVIGKYNENKTFLSKVETKWDDIYKVIKEELELMIKYANILKEEVQTEEIVCNDILLIINSYKNIDDVNELINNYSKIENCYEKFTIIYNNHKLSKTKKIKEMQEELNNLVSKIEYGREIYNNELNNYYSDTTKFISNLICKVFKFKRYNIFK